MVDKIERVNSEELLQNEFLNFYEVYKKYKMNQANNEDGEKKNLYFNANDFSVRTNPRSVYGYQSGKYSKEQVRRFLSNPIQYQRQIREISIYLYAICQEYKNLIQHFSNMLTHDYILIPDGIAENKFDTKAMENNFLKTLNFIDNYAIKDKLSNIEPMLIREDLYFAYERSDSENYTWQQLPTNYCRISGSDSFGCYTFEFDFTYFNKTNVDIDNFHEDLQYQYDLFKTNYQVYRWQKLDPKKAICFKFDKSLIYGLPIFSGIFDELLGLEGYKDLQKTSTQGNNYKLLHQKIPMRNSKDAKGLNDYLIDSGDAKIFHNNVKSNLPGYIGVVTTPMDINSITLNSNRFDEDVVSKVESNLFFSAGVSQLLFGGQRAGSIGLVKSIENCSSAMFKLLKQYELWFKKRLSLVGNSVYKWKLMFPDITVYNRSDFLDQSLKLGQYGFPKSLSASCVGLSQRDLIGLNNLENKQLKLVDNLIPLQSSHVMTDDDDEGGRPEVDLPEDVTAVQIDNETTDNRAEE